MFTDQKLWAMFKYFDTGHHDQISFEDLVAIHKREGDTVNE